jgi:hypothetical protein
MDMDADLPPGTAEQGNWATSPVEADGECSEEHGPPAPEHAYTGTELEIYQTLLAVERGELSPEQAALRLDDIEARSREGQGQGPPGADTSAD